MTIYRLEMLLSMLTLIDLGTLQLVSRLTVLDSLALLNTNIVTQSSQTGDQGMVTSPYKVIECSLHRTNFLQQRTQSGIVKSYL